MTETFEASPETMWVLPADTFVGFFAVTIDEHDRVAVELDEQTADKLEDAWEFARRGGAVPRKRPEGHVFNRTGTPTGNHLYVLDPITAEHLGQAWWFAQSHLADMPPEHVVLHQTVALLSAAGQAAHARGILHPPEVGTVANLAHLRRV
jgi:hypothetical protein